MNPQKQSAAQRIAALMNKPQIIKTTPIIPSQAQPIKPKRTTRGGLPMGGTRPPSGKELARRSLRALLASHYEEELDVTLIDPLTKKKVTVKKPRVVIVMEKMYEIATRKAGDSAAGDRWLNRALGKAPQPLIGDSDEEPIAINLGVGRILGKAYNDDDDTESIEE